MGQFPADENTPMPATACAEPRFLNRFERSRKVKTVLVLNPSTHSPTASIRSTSLSPRDSERPTRAASPRRLRERPARGGLADGVRRAECGGGDQGQAVVAPSPHARRAAQLAADLLKRLPCRLCHALRAVCRTVMYELLRRPFPGAVLESRRWAPVAHDARGCRAAQRKPRDGVCAAGAPTPRQGCTLRGR